MYFKTFVPFFLHCILLFTDLAVVLQHLGQSAARSRPHVANTSDTSADESERSHLRRRVRLKRTYKMRKVVEADVVVRFFVTGATDAQMQLAN